MLDWLKQHHEAANILLSLGMLVVWLVYLHVFLSSYRRQKQANILIGVGGGSGLEARCLVTNLSQSAVYIRSLVLVLTTAEGTASHPVTEMEELEEWSQPTDLNLWTRQGPLGPGGVRDMGSFRTMLAHALRATEAGSDAVETRLERVESLWLTVIAHYGPEDLMVAAEQGYAILRRDGSVRLHPQSIRPRQIRSRRERERLMAWLERGI